MQVIADLHLHSKYSRATSPKMNTVDLALAGKRKGVNLLATGDFLHPAYFQELKKTLHEDGSGFLTLKNGDKDSKFVLSGEVSCIYKDKDKTRRVHMLYLLPDFASVGRVIAELEKHKCNLRSDGRPIVGLSAKNLSEIFLTVSEKCLIVPAHIWTPWFALFGSKSGYDSLSECFEDLTPWIFAVETGLSSDPAMNWRWSALDKLALVSNSDAHSLDNLGREANVFEFTDFTYVELHDTLQNKNNGKFLFTVEFYPQEGRYHFDGHAACKFSCSPEEALRRDNLCPICGRLLTLGVEHRVNDLADREIGFCPKDAIPYKSLVPLIEIIAEVLDQGKNTKAVKNYYENLLSRGENEFNILLNLDKKALNDLGGERFAEAVSRVRQGKLIIEPGFDGEYGVVKIFSEQERAAVHPRQKNLL